MTAGEGENPTVLNFESIIADQECGSRTHLTMMFRQRKTQLT